MVAEEVRRPLEVSITYRTACGCCDSEAHGSAKKKMKENCVDDTIIRIVDWWHVGSFS